MFGRVPEVSPVGSATLDMLSDFTSRIRTRLLASCQLVAHVPSSKGAPWANGSGIPLCNRMIPVNCHPPMIPLSARLEPLNNHLSRPNGSAISQLELRL